ncbi:uncharacterized protein PAC_05325 [Phialocephala subalpina]|uniref:BTB domain-containing protein n=1 Tax=Phialocephala subalpina TaxID=576137 RepID=A0A1L7WRQ6_9HELO|nr:uncharacterized protein PAC_05325 [Phialocephala subalpina]
MAPLTKRQKTGDGNFNSPIAFPCAGQSPDVRLIVFKQEFHVHSTLLKLNTAFFRKFLDSPEKAVNDPNGSGEVALVGPMSTFTYEWVTKIDEGGDKWSLVSDNKKNEPYNLSTYTGDKQEQTNAFEKLLSAIYVQPYKLGTAEELLLMTDLADYYCALPILSRTLDGALINSPTFSDQIQKSANELYVAAAKLRNALLFRECLIWVVGPHNNPVYKTLDDPRLRMVARCAHGEISTKIASVTARALRRGTGDWVKMANSKPDRWAYGFDRLMFGPLYDGYYDNMDMDAVHYPRWFRDIEQEGDELLDDESGDFEGLLEDKLVLDRGYHTAGDADKYPDNFFCAQVSDEDLPWDVNETDW